MRHSGDSNEYNEQRAREIMDAYRRIMSNYGGKVSTLTIYEMVAFSPATRFFIGKSWAYRVVRNYGSRKKQFDSRQRMYAEIHRRVTELRQLRPDITLPDAVGIVISQPAPEMYLTPAQVRRIIMKEMQRQAAERMRIFQERQKRLGFCCTKMK